MWEIQIQTHQLSFYMWAVQIQQLSYYTWGIQIQIHFFSLHNFPKFENLEDWKH